MTGVVVKLRERRREARRAAPGAAKIAPIHADAAWRLMLHVTSTSDPKRLAGYAAARTLGWLAAAAVLVAAGAWWANP